MNDGDSLGRDFREAFRPLLRRMNASRSLSLGKGSVLAYLADHDRATASELASSERVSPQAIAVAVKELDELGLISRTADEADKRRIWIEITPAGRHRLDQERLAGLDWLDRLIDEKLTAQERAALDAAIPVLRKLSQDQKPDGP